MRDERVYKVIRSIEPSLYEVEAISYDKTFGDGLVIEFDDESRLYASIVDFTPNGYLVLVVG